MSMTSMLAQEEGRAFVEAAEVSGLLLLLALFLFERGAAPWTRQGTQQHDTSTNRNQDNGSAQLHGTYFNYKDEDENEGETLDNVFQCLPDSSLGTNGTKARKLAMKVTKKLFPSLTKVMIKRSNKLNKGHICLKWHSATKAQSAQEELVKRIDPGYGWKIEVVRDPTENPPPSPPTPVKIGEAHATTLSAHFGRGFTGVTTCLKRGIHITTQASSQLPMINHCPEWVDNEPTCATNFASMEFPIFAKDTEDMEASAAGSDIQLAQSWESPSAINSKATWDS
eukprot:jgi/Psemu1/25002/gm1.25002_g